jgi:hypothetical protein
VRFEGYFGQTESDFSLALADDGSGPGVDRLVREFSDRGLSIRHLWQEDSGFRKARILNRAIGSSEADYVILSEGRRAGSSDGPGSVYASRNSCPAC